MGLQRLSTVGGSHQQQMSVVPTTFECANPILSVANMARSVRYYVDVLGFANASWGGDDFTCVTRDGAGIYLSEGDQGHRYLDLAAVKKLLETAGGKAAE
jgi:catechol 2,3-dioxygenase-like lactoylglutathione lyase family enzyme